MADPYQPDHAGEAEGELLVQFRSKPSIVGFIRGLVAPIQTLEDDAWDLRADRLLTTAAGVQLDVLGRLVGEVRGGLSDADYRKFIGARILINTSGGNPDRQIEVFRIIAGPKTAGTAVWYQLMGNGLCFRLTIIRDAPLTAALAARVNASMAEICPSGVGSTLVEGSPTAFRFDLGGPGFDLGTLAHIL
jgi:hypothetical protein